VLYRISVEYVDCTPPISDELNRAEIVESFGAVAVEQLVSHASNAWAEGAMDD
jgi:hypothetical protein